MPGLFYLSAFVLPVPGLSALSTSAVPVPGFFYSFMFAVFVFRLSVLSAFAVPITGLFALFPSESAMHIVGPELSLLSFSSSVC